MFYFLFIYFKYVAMFHYYSVCLCAVQIISNPQSLINFAFWEKHTWPFYESRMEKRASVHWTLAHWLEWQRI